MTDSMPKWFIKLCIIEAQLLHILHRLNKSESLVCLAQGHFTEENLQSNGLNCRKRKKKMPEIMAE